MKILVTNDDGIYAPGLWKLAEELSKIARVVIVAPDRERSAIGTAVSLHHPLRVQKVRSLLPRVETYSVEGTPADSVILALSKLFEGKVDMVISGINQGQNLGEDVLISGTVGAALLGYLRGLPAIAVSADGLDDLYLNDAAKFVALLAKKVVSSALPTNIFLNVNLPDLPLAEVGEIRITRLGASSHVDTVEEGHDGKRAYYWLVRQKVNTQAEKKTDIWAINQGNISITPLHIFWGNKISPAVLNRLCSDLLQELKERKRVQK